MNPKKSSDPKNHDDLLQRLAKAQEYVRAHVPANTSLADELIAEWREEARRELDDEAE
jgi:hypothetical protein